MDRVAGVYSRVGFCRLSGSPAMTSGFSPGPISKSLPHGIFLGLTTHNHQKEMAYVCLHCSKKYSTSSHLRRHEASHLDNRPFVCSCCHKSFARSDVFRRHALHCPENGDASPLPVAKPGRKKASCDHCARVKSCCDRDLPCERCLACGVNCTYSRLTTSATQDEATFAVPREEKMSISFLLSYTSSTTVYSHLKQFSAVDNVSSLEEAPDSPHNPAPPWSPCLPSLDISFSEMMFEMLGTPSGYFENVPSQDASISFLDTTVDPLQDRINSVLCDLRRFVSVKDHLPAASREPAIKTAYDLLTPWNIRSAMRAWFCYVHPNCPVVHEPSFDITRASTSLLLAMFAAGCSFIQAQIPTLPSGLLDLIEDYVFHDPRLDITYQETTGDSSTAVLEALQAATIVMSLRAGISDPEAQQRIRDCRFPRLINALRSKQAFSSRNRALRELGRAPFDWQHFIQEECLISDMNRITFATSMFDAHYTIFFRAPPRLTLQEVTGDLPCADCLFTAGSSEACQRLLIAYADIQPPSLASLVNMLMQEPLFDPGDRILQGLSVRHLFLLIISTYPSMIEYQRNRNNVADTVSIEQACMLPYSQPKARALWHISYRQWRELLNGGSFSGTTWSEINLQMTSWPVLGL
ncbi:hypothetical protein BJX70DRAFT_62547 [Aspergillus crustosus]